MKKFAPILAIVVAATCVATLAFADTRLDDFAARLAELRSEVESLSTTVEQKKEERRTRLRSLAGQKSDLEFQLQREESRIAQLEAQAEKKRKELAEDAVDGEDLLPAVQASMEELRGRVDASLPFKKTERLGAIDELDQKIRQGLVTPQKASVQLWALVEDELRLGRENGLYRQVIRLDGEEVLVDVARLGMVAMYFRTDDGLVGRVTHDAGEWAWVEEAGEVEKRQIHQLFDAMRKQIRTGFFELPGPIEGGGQ